MAELRRLGARVRPEIYEWLQKNAEVRGLSINAMVILALETYIQQQDVLPLLPSMLEELKKHEK